MEKILVIDDEMSISILLKRNLRKAGYYVISSLDGEEGLQFARREAPDLILLEPMLSGFDGLEICKTLRLEKNNTPILIITANESEIDKILSLEMGADDYVIKPFDPREVIARVKAILRRTKKVICSSQPDSQEEVYKFGPIQIDANRYEVKFLSNKLELTPSEFDVLLYLVKHKGKIIKREQLLNAIKRTHQARNPRVVDLHIYHLRKKIESNPEKPKLIKTVRGLGYTLEFFS